MPTNDPLSMLMALRGLPDILMEQLKTKIGLSGLYQDQIDQAYQPILDEAGTARQNAAQARTNYEQAQQAPLPNMPVGQQVGANSLAAAAEMLNPKGGFVKKNQEDQAVSRAGMLQKRAERLAFLEKASDAAAERASRMGDLALQVKHTKEAEKWGKLRADITESIGGYYEQRQKHMDAMSENLDKFRKDMAVARETTRREVMLKYGVSEDKLTPMLAARLRALDEGFKANEEFIKKRMEIAGNSLSGNSEELMQQLTKAHQDNLVKYNQDLETLFSGQPVKPPVDTTPDPNETVHAHAVNAIQQGVTDVNEFRHALLQHSTDVNGVATLDGVPVDNYVAYGRKYFARFAQLRAKAEKIQALLAGQTGVAGRKFATNKRLGQQLNELNKELAAYGYTVAAPLPQVQGIDTKVIQ